MSKKVTIQENQTLLDIAVQQYGDIDGVFNILSLNKELEFDKQLTPGDIIICDESDNIKASYFRNKTIATDADRKTATIDWILDNGCWNDDNYWIDERYWKDQCDRWILELGWWDDGKIWDDSAIWNDG